MKMNIKYPVAFHTVDMATTRTHNGRIQVLLAQKIKDTEGGKNVWRFPGGFIDPWDSCAEEAALREGMEESGMKFVESPDIDKHFALRAPLIKKVSALIEELADDDEINVVIKKIQKIKLTDSSLTWMRANVRYVGSTTIDDARYRDSIHKIITTLYELTPMPGFDKDGEGPFDDIARTKWFNLHEIKTEIMHPSHTVLFDMLFDKYKVKIQVNKMTDTLEKLGDDLKKGAHELFGHVDQFISDIKK